MQEDDLRQLDEAGYAVVDAITYVRSPTHQSGYTPHLFSCMDGRHYWVKSTAQQGLVAELIAGRLASSVEAGQHACVIRVPPEAVAGTPLAPSIAGIKVGSLDMPNAVNIKDLDTIGVATLDSEKIDPGHRAKVVVFQSWIAAGDAQVLLDMGSGRICSIDHGDVFGNTNDHTTPVPLITGVPGVADNHGCKAEFVEEALKRVESIDDHALLQAVAGVPLGENWQSGRARRLDIAKWLASRRDRLREAMRAWT